MNTKELIAKLRKLKLKPQSCSGRYMQGQPCVGVIVRSLGEHTLPSGYHYDNMAGAFVVYWVNAYWEGK